MNRNYLFKHWLTTLILAPFMAAFYEFLTNTTKGQINGLLEGYATIFIFSFFFSLPTFLIYYFVFSFLIKQNTNPSLTKVILISLTVIGIAATIFIIGGSMTRPLIYFFSISAVIAGILFRITNKMDTAKELKTG